MGEFSRTWWGQKFITAIESFTNSASTATSLKEFWQGQTITPTSIDEPRETNISAILVKKAGNLPEFWHRDTSFISTMEEFYQRVKTKNRDLF